MSQFSVTFSYSVPMKFGKFTKQYEYIDGWIGSISNE